MIEKMTFGTCVNCKEQDATTAVLHLCEECCSKFNKITDWKQRYEFLGKEFPRDNELWYKAGIKQATQPVTDEIYNRWLELRGESNGSDS